jgi:hypothetical protein
LWNDFDNCGLAARTDYLIAYLVEQRPNVFHRHRIRKTAAMIPSSLLEKQTGPKIGERFMPTRVGDRGACCMRTMGFVSVERVGELDDFLPVG